MSTDLVIILSTDWVGSTATRAEVGEEPADALQELHDALLRRVIDAAGGKVVKHSGDGVLAIFHSATSALAAAAKIQQDFAAYRSSPDAVAPMDIRTGLAAGDVQHQAGDIFGMPVVEAVRLQSAAEPNEILCSDLVRMLSQGRGGFEFADAGALQLKGLPAPVQAWKVRPPNRAATGSASVDTKPSGVPIATPRGPTTLTSRATLTYALAAALVVAGAGALAYRFLGGDAPTAVLASQPPQQGSRQPTPAARSIAVLPFINLSPNEDDAYFAVGIHEEILNQLTKLGSLRVVARTSVQRYATTQKSVPEIARELNVETVMEGSVRYADGRVLVTTQLINGATDAHVWSESYERDFSNIFAIQSDIALKVAQALKATLLPAERERVQRVPTTSLRAYDLYLSATARGQRQTTRDDLLLGIQEADQALALDPDFALAWARKSFLSTLTQVFDPARGAEYQALGEQAARRALEIDPMLGAAHSALGFSLTQKSDWSGSEAAFRRALTLNVPLGDMPAYSVLQLSVGNFAYAREILQDTREVEPQNPAALLFLMMANALLGDWATATAQYELGTRFFAPWSLGDNLMMHLRIAREGLEAARGFPTDDPIDRVMLANLDAPQTARRELRRMHVDPALADPVSQKGIALWAADFGDAALALDAIRSAVTQRGANMVQVWLPQFAEARKLPGFKALLRDLGIVAYWREYGWQAVCGPLAADDFECN